MCNKRSANVCFPPEADIRARKTHPSARPLSQKPAKLEMASGRWHRAGNNDLTQSGAKTMTHLACPTALVDAPAEAVWFLLTQPAGWGSFYDMRVTAVAPTGPAIAGQVIEGESGPQFLHLKIEIRLVDIDATNHRLSLNVKLPFGVTVREDMNCIPIGANQCRINYRCGFSFPAGWRGTLLRLAMRREVDSGPLDSIMRLKRAAERRWGQSKV
jgi:hypothetical protein